MMEPRLILRDEPAAGVNETLAQELFDHIQVLNTQGITFLVIEHNMNLIMRLSDELVVMHNGRTLAQGLPADIQRNQDVLDAYLGGRVCAMMYSTSRTRLRATATCHTWLTSVRPWRARKNV